MLMSKYMKRFLALLTASLMALSAIAQTPEEVFARVNEVRENSEKEGMVMTMTMKIPIVGSFSSRIYSLGTKSRTEITGSGRSVTLWSDGETAWSYDSEDNEIVIDAVKRKADEGNGLKMMEDITEGYDVSLDQETDAVWTFVCKKRRDNPKKDDPKKMVISIKKGSYLLDRLQASMKGVTMTISDVSFGGISDEFVTFSAASFPNAKITDRRDKE